MGSAAPSESVKALVVGLNKHKTNNDTSPHPHRLPEKDKKKRKKKKKEKKEKKKERNTDAPGQSPVASRMQRF